MAGDKCVQGTETYFFELVRECPALPPQGLYLRVQGQPIYLPRKSITFELTQFAVRIHNIMKLLLALNCCGVLHYFSHNNEDTVHR